MIKYALSLLSLVCGCVGTDVGNPVESRNDVALIEPTFQAGIDLGENSGEVTEAWLVVDDVRLYSGTDCSNEYARYEEENVINLLGSGSSEMFGDIDLSAACAVVFDISIPEEALPATAPAELEGFAAYFAGTWGDSGTFSVRLGELPDIRVMARDTQTLFGASKLFFTVAARQVFEGSYLDTAEVDAEGVVRVEEGSNDAIRAAVEAALRGAFRIYDDDDGDGELDDDEYDSDDDILAD